MFKLCGGQPKELLYLVTSKQLRRSKLVSTFARLLIYNHNVEHIITIWRLIWWARTLVFLHSCSNRFIFTGQYLRYRAGSCQLFLLLQSLSCLFLSFLLGLINCDLNQRLVPAAMGTAVRASTSNPPFLRRFYFQTFITTPPMTPSAS